MFVTVKYMQLKNVELSLYHGNEILLRLETTVRMIFVLTGTLSP